MICKECGSIIRHEEEYCRKCGSLVINFKNQENKALKNICTENNIKGKLQGIVNKFVNTDKKQHDVEQFNKKERFENGINNLENNINDLKKKINDFMLESFEIDGQGGLSEEEIENGIKKYDNKEVSYDGLVSKSVKELIDEAKKMLNKKS